MCAWIAGTKILHLVITTAVWLSPAILVRVQNSTRTSPAWGQYHPYLHDTRTTQNYSDHLPSPFTYFYCHTFFSPFLFPVSGFVPITAIAQCTPSVCSYSPERMAWRSLTFSGMSHIPRVDQEAVAGLHQVTHSPRAIFFTNSCSGSCGRCQRHPAPWFVNSN